MTWAPEQPEPTRRIGVLGGAFDPPHMAHQALARAAIEALELDELRVVPTGVAWHKARVLSPAADRLTMTRLAFADIPRTVVDACEILRPGASYTVDTLRQLKLNAPGAQLFLILGADQARALPQWHAWREILELAIICVAERATPTGAGIENGLDFSPPKAHAGRFRHLPFAHLAVSATDIRARVALQQDIAELVCAPVAQYIEQHHLYQTTA